MVTLAKAFPRRRWWHQRLPPSALALPDAARESRIFLAYAVLLTPAALVTGLLIRDRPLPLGLSQSFLTDAWYVLLFKGTLMLLVPIALHRRLGHRLGELRFGWRASPGSLTRVLMALLAGASLNLGWVPEIRAAFAAGPIGFALFWSACGALEALLTAGLPEELLFRGLLQTRLECALGRLAAIAITTVVFTAWHLPTRYLLAHGLEGEAGDVVSVLGGTGIPVAVLSLVFSLAWDRFRNLPALVAAHWGVDALPTMAFFLGVTPH